VVVIDEKEQRTLATGGPEKVQDGGVHCSPIAAGRRGEIESRAQGPCLGSGQERDPILQGPEEVGDGNERQIRLGLPAGSPQHRGSLPRPGGPIEQGGLADARLTYQSKKPALTDANQRQKLFDLCLFNLTPEDHASNLPART
jgi:hypothetical protein